LSEGAGCLMNWNRVKTEEAYRAESGLNLIV
jgi:hypothetical protein